MPTKPTRTKRTAGTPSTARTNSLIPTRSTAADSLETLVTPSYFDIAERAYQLYLQRGGAHGRDVEDWLRAERELRPQA